MKTREYKLNLTHSQLKLILESLLFHTSVDVNSRWCKNECDEGMKLAENLRNLYPKILTDNLFVFNETIYHDETTEKIVDLFPEVLENKPNI